MNYSNEHYSHRNIVASFDYNKTIDLELLFKAYQTES